MQDNIRIENERKYWDKLTPRYEPFLEKCWSVLDKISKDIGVGNAYPGSCYRHWLGSPEGC